MSANGVTKRRSLIAGAAVAAFTVLTVEGNVGGGTQTVTGPTDGYWDNPAASFTHR
jgi:hypothetical protein